MLREIYKQLRVTQAAIAAVLLLLLLSSTVFAATINMRVETDKGVYTTGDTVSWTVYAWASTGDNDGVQFLAIDLDDNTDDTMQPPLNNGAGEFTDTAYGIDEGFIFITWGIPKTKQELSDILDISVMQMPITPILNPNIGNDGQIDHVFVKGSFVVHELGHHYLTIPRIVANYWSIESSKAFPFENQVAFSAMFIVEPDGDINRDGVADLNDFAMISAYWQVNDCGRATDCGRTDVNLDGKVDLADIMILADQWLSKT